MKNKLQSVLKVLKLLKYTYEFRINSNYARKFFGCFGMCSFVRNERKYNGSITSEEEEAFNQYYKRSKRGQKVFYDYQGNKTDDTNQFGWPATDLKSRLKWINRHIERIESGKSLW